MVSFKALLATASLFATLGAQAGTFYRVECEGFSGVVENAEVRGKTVLFERATSSKAVAGLPRTSLAQMTGMVLDACQGPYAIVYQRETQSGGLHCESIQELGQDLSEMDILRSFSLSGSELACSVILSTHQAQIFRSL